MKKLYNTPEMTKISFVSSDIITNSNGMKVGTFTTGMILGEADFGEFDEMGF